MGKYHASNLDLSTRIEIAAEMMLPVKERGWGRVTELARTHGVSRTRLYQLKDSVHDLFTTALMPKNPGPQVSNRELRVDEALIKKAISTFPLIKGSVRDIQIGLELLFGVQRSVGYISQTLQEAGARAAQYNAQVVAQQPVLAEADEIFQGRHPCLTVVDGHSFLLMNLTPAEARDEISWGVTFLELDEQGYEFQDVVADGARGIAAGLSATGWGLDIRPDLFHLLHEAHPISQRLERAAYQAIETADQSRLVAAAAQQPCRKRGRPAQAKLSVPEAEEMETTTIETLDLWLWLLQEVRLALEPITPLGHICTPQVAQNNIEIAIELMAELGREDISKFAQKLHKYLDDLMAPLVELENRLAPARATLSDEDERLITFIWQQRQELAFPWTEMFPTTWQATVQAFDKALSLFHRASSLAESIHAWVRPYLQIHRGMPQWLAPLLQLFWNQHRFQRGKRAGFTPAELAGLSELPSLAQLFANLFEPDAIPTMC
jgi:hypothetical protein